MHAVAAFAVRRTRAVQTGRELIEVGLAERYRAEREQFGDEPARRESPRAVGGAKCRKAQIE